MVFVIVLDALFILFGFHCGCGNKKHNDRVRVIDLERRMFDFWNFLNTALMGRREHRFS